MHKIVDDLGKNAGQPPCNLWTNGLVEKWITAATPASQWSRTLCCPQAEAVVHSAACEFCYSSDGHAHLPSADSIMDDCPGSTMTVYRPCSERSRSGNAHSTRRRRSSLQASPVYATSTAALRSSRVDRSLTLRLGSAPAVPELRAAEPAPDRRSHSLSVVSAPTSGSRPKLR